METTDSVSSFFFYLCGSGRAYMFFCYFFSLTGRQTVAFSLLIYSYASNGRNKDLLCALEAETRRDNSPQMRRWSRLTPQGSTGLIPVEKKFYASETGIMSAWWLMSNPFMHLHVSKKGKKKPILLQRAGEVGCPLSFNQSASTLLQLWVFIAS